MKSRAQGKPRHHHLFIYFPSLNLEPFCLSAGSLRSTGVPVCLGQNSVSAVFCAIWVGCEAAGGSVPRATWGAEYCLCYCRGCVVWPVWAYTWLGFWVCLWSTAVVISVGLSESVVYLLLICCYYCIGCLIFDICRLVSILLILLVAQPTSFLSLSLWPILIQNNLPTATDI